MSYPFLHYPVSCREVNERYMREMARVSFRLLEVFALGLGLPPRALDHMFLPAHTSFLRLNYYVSVVSVSVSLSASMSVNVDLNPPG